MRGGQDEVLVARVAHEPVPEGGHEPDEGDPGERDHVEAGDHHGPPSIRVTLEVQELGVGGIERG